MSLLCFRLCKSRVFFVFEESRLIISNALCHIYFVLLKFVESTVHATATIDKSCDERLDVEKRFPRMVSYLEKEFIYRLWRKDLGSIAEILPISFANNCRYV